MSDFPETRESLLLRLRSTEDFSAWERFVRLYRPVIHRLARGRGLQEADAEDVCQRVLLAVAGAIGEWGRGHEGARFRHWLRRVARNAILNALTRAPRDRALGGSTSLALLLEQPEPDDPAERALEDEFRRELYRLAAERVRDEIQPSTWRAFEATEIEGRAFAEVAEELGLSLGNLYAARSRVMRRLRDVVHELENDEEAT